MELKIALVWPQINSIKLFWGHLQPFCNTLLRLIESKIVKKFDKIVKKLERFYKQDRPLWRDCCGEIGHLTDNVMKIRTWSCSGDTYSHSAALFSHKSHCFLFLISLFAGAPKSASTLVKGFFCLLWFLGTACNTVSKQSLSVDYRHLWLDIYGFSNLVLEI